MIPSDVLPGAPVPGHVAPGDGPGDVASHLDAVMHLVGAVWGVIHLDGGAVWRAGAVPQIIPACHCETPPPVHWHGHICVALLTIRTSALGRLMLGSAETAHAPSESRDRLIAVLADGLAHQVHGQHLQQRVTRLTGQLAMIGTLGRQNPWTAGATAQQALLEQITRITYETIGHDHLQLLLADEARQTMTLVYAHGPAGARLLAEGYSESISGRGIISWVARCGEIWVCNDVTRDPHFASHHILDDTIAEIAVPLRVGARVIGVLDVQSAAARGFDADDVFLLRIVADQIAASLEHARLFDAEQRERELAMTLSDISRVLCSSLELDQVLAMILSQIERVVPHLGTRITLLTDDTRMHVVAAKGYPDNSEAEQAHFAITDAPLAPAIMYARETVVVCDAHTDPRWLWLPGTRQVRSWCGTPLVIRDRAIGFLCVDWNEPGFYTEDHAHILRAFADQAAVAIENARLFDAVRRFSGELEHLVAARTAELREAHNSIAAQTEQLRALVRQVVMVQENERQRIAHELHDSLVQAILAVMYQLHAIRRRVGPSTPPGVLEQIDDSRQLLESTLLEMKSIIHALRPRALDELGLLAALRHFAQSAGEHHDSTITFRSSGTAYPLHTEIELPIYRIVQEATQNAMRHAAAGLIAISVECRPNMLRVIINDDGCGFDPAVANDGLGLVGMRERAQAIGARLDIVSAVGRGTRVRLEVPRSVIDGGPDHA
jgi:signal transduction histidine kinase